MKCPKCGKRAFDISKLPEEKIEIEMKCPNCHQFITVSCVEEMILKIKSNINVKRRYA
jgi:peptide subunit release factor 1 (eRF1)